MGGSVSCEHTPSDHRHTGVILHSKSGYVDSGTRKKEVAAAVIRLDYVVRLPTYRTVYR